MFPTLDVQTKRL